MLMEAMSLSRVSCLEFTRPRGCPNLLHLRRQCRISSIHFRTSTSNSSLYSRFRFKAATTFDSACQSLRNSDNETARTANNNNSKKLKAIFEALLRGWKSPLESKAVIVGEFLRRFMALVLILLALGFIPLQRRAFAAPALAAAAAAVEKNNVQTQVEDEICAYERELTEAIMLLEQRLQQEVQGNKEKDEVQRVQEALHLLTAKILSVRSNVLIHNDARTRRMKKLEGNLLKEAEQVAKSYLKAKRELDKLVQAHGDEKLKEMSVNKVMDAEDRFRAVWSALTKLEADLVAKETEGLRLAFQQIPAIQEKVDHLLQPKPNPTSTSEYQMFVKESIVARIRKDLYDAIKKTWERMTLPGAVDLEEPKLPLDEERRKTLECIKTYIRKSRKMQEQLNSLVRDQLKGAGEEKLLLVVTPQEDVVKGFPPVELKWLFGEIEVHAPGAASFYMAQGWKSWREETKANLKKKLLEDVVVGKKYVAERQARVLLYRDRVIAKTWYNANEKRWEMDPVAAAYAVTKELVGRARIRHDWAVMYIVLKGDDRDYYVDIQEFNARFKQVGGFDGLYVKMVTSGVPTTVEFMWIPFKEWDLCSQIMIPIKVLYRSTIQMWNSKLVSKARTWYLNKLILIFDDFMVQEGFDFYYNLARKKLYDSVWFFEWRIRTEKRFKEATAGGNITESRNKKRGRGRGKGIVGDLFWWFLKLSIRFLFYAYPLLLLFRFLREKYSRICEQLSYVFSAEPANPELPFRRGLINRFRKKMLSRGKKNGFFQKSPMFRGDIKVAFDRMKRIRNPPLRLEEIAGIDAVKEEVIEVVTFLKNPKHFQEMGARAPRGILILGDSEAPKETLVAAIAAEAKVPLVEVKQHDFISLSNKVGQAPARIRELFQTARDLAPLIIYVEKFDSVAGSRGEINDTKKKFRDTRDHEAMINQFLVELDGFETQEGVVFIASAETPDAIDEALRRPGRIDRTFTISLPNEKERLALLQSGGKLTMHGDLIDWKKVAEKTFGLTASQVESIPHSMELSSLATKTGDDEELFSIYGWLATIGNVTPHWLKKSKWMKNLNAALIDWLGLQVTKEDIESTVQLMEPYDMISPGLEIDTPPFTWTREFKLPYAVWAAGRGLVALLLPNFHSVDLIWLEPTGWKGVGFTKFTREGGGDLEDSQVKSRSYLEKKLVLCFGSYVATRLLLPPEECNNLSRLEIEEARQIATRMVLEYGWGPDDNHMVYWTMNLQYKGNLNLGMDHKSELEAKIEKLFNTACDKAAELLLKNRRALDALVEHLLEYDVVNRKGMLRIMEENGAVQEPDPFMLMTYKNYEFNAGMATNGTGRISATP